MAGDAGAADVLWEHSVIELNLRDAAESRARLDALGMERWELVSVVYAQPLNGITGVAFLKRAMRAAPEG